jgi:malonyl-CoA decarboxylase
MSAVSFLRKLIGGGARAGMDKRTEELVSLCNALLAESGEYASTALARDALAAYQKLDERCQEEFFGLLSRDYGPPVETVSRAAAAYQAEPTHDNLLRLQQAVDSPRQELFRRLNMAPGGTAALVEMRRQLLKGLRAHAEWKPVDSDLMHLLRSWFNRGFLRLERIDWHTSAMVLEKLIEYEAVHAIQGWRDLRRRLEYDRRCFAFFHPQLPDEPIIFIEVALTRGMAAQVQPLLDIRTQLADPANADCAMFYSITNCQEGLRGISFGNQLIKQVVEDLKGEFPHIKRFATLSPIPGFRRWLESTPLSGDDAELVARLADPAWHLGEIPEPLQLLLTRLCGYYLVRAKSGLEPLDPVARFHLANGAVLERLNWMGDTSESGMQRAAGMMVNYVYWLDELEKNHERYFRDHEVVASPAIERLAKEAPVGAEKPA